jgi:RNA polymerase sigma-70 factor (ECF subfamily)
LILLADQDRSLWNREQIAEGAALVERAIESRRFGPYTLQAAIAAVHAEAESADATDWSEIVGLYDVLLRAEPSPVIELNRAVAVAMRDGPTVGLQLIDAIFPAGICSTTGWRMPPEQTFAADWARPYRLAPPTSARSR